MVDEFEVAAKCKSISLAARSFKGSIKATCLASNNWASSLGCKRCRV